MDAALTSTSAISACLLCGLDLTLRLTLCMREGKDLRDANALPRNHIMHWSDRHYLPSRYIVSDVLGHAWSCRCTVVVGMFDPMIPASASYTQAHPPRFDQTEDAVRLSGWSRYRTPYRVSDLSAGPPYSRHISDRVTGGNKICVNAAPLPYVRRLGVLAQPLTSRGTGLCH